MYLLKILILSIIFNATYGIINGSRASINDFPYQVSLSLKGQHMCSGVFISTKHVLTIAQCVEKWIKEPDNISVISSTTLLNSPLLTYVVDEIIVHPFYKGAKMKTKKYDLIPSHDIAIVILQKEIEKQLKQKPVKIWEQGILLPNNSKLITSGWGYAKCDAVEYSWQLRMATVKIISTDECEKYLPYGWQLEKYHLCVQSATNYTKHSAKGDEGNPLVYKDSLIGVLSKYTDCNRDEIEVYVSICHFADFIIKVVPQSMLIVDEGVNVWLKRCMTKVKEISSIDTCPAIV